MSGIFGLWQLDGRPVETGQIVAMSERLAHRGPDDSGVWCGETVGLGHRMLHTTPESLIEKQPVVIREGDRVLTADARVDNRDDLIGALGLGGRRPAEITDAELILRAHEKWGRECPEKIIGDFAFAIWDERKHELFCARDPMGVKPFYYHLVPGRLFAFASEIKGLFAVPAVPRKLNELQIAYYIERVTDDREITFFEGVLRLPAAHTLSVGREHVRIEKYWGFDPVRDVRYGSTEEYAEAFKEVFVESVRCRLRSAFPVGSTLSGGLDSSSIVCTGREMLREEGRGPLHTFSALFPGLPPKRGKLVHEGEYIDAVVRGGGVLPHYIRADRLTALGDLDLMMAVQDEPTLGPNLYVYWALFGAAEDAGVRVMLEGSGGDSTVSYGYERLGEDAQNGQWERFATEATWLSQRTGVSPDQVVNSRAGPALATLARSLRWRAWLRATGALAGRLPVSRSGLFVRHGLGALAPPAAIACVRRLTGRATGHRSWLNPALARRLRIKQRRHRLEQHWRRDAGPSQGGLAPSKEDHLLSLADPLMQVGLEMVGGTVAAFAVEPRYPFLDRRLLEFCLAVPADQKLAEGWARAILRRAMEGVLPREVQWRVLKQNLSPNFLHGLHDGDRSVVDAAVFGGALEGYVNDRALKATYREFYAHDGREGEGNGGFVLFQAAVLGRWLEGRPLPAVPRSRARSALRPAGAGPRAHHAVLN